MHDKIRSEGQEVGDEEGSDDSLRAQSPTRTCVSSCVSARFSISCTNSSPYSKRTSTAGAIGERSASPSSPPSSSSIQSSGLASTDCGMMSNFFDGFNGQSYVGKLQTL